MAVVMHQLVENNKVQITLIILTVLLLWELIRNQFEQRSLSECHACYVTLENTAEEEMLCLSQRLALPV